MCVSVCAYFVKRNNKKKHDTYILTTYIHPNTHTHAQRARETRLEKKLSTRDGSDNRTNTSGDVRTRQQTDW